MHRTKKLAFKAGRAVKRDYELSQRWKVNAWQTRTGNWAWRLEYGPWIVALVGKALFRAAIRSTHGIEIWHAAYTTPRGAMEATLANAREVMKFRMGVLEDAEKVKP